MSFYILRQDTLIEGSALIGGVPESMDVLEWLQGKSNYNPATSPELILDLAYESGDYRGHIIGGFATVFHFDLKAALDSQGVSNVRYYPVRLRDPNNGSTEGGYFLTKIIDVLDCVDVQKSKTKPWITGIGFDFLSMVLDESKTQGLKIFRLKEDPTKIIINEDLKQYFDNVDMLAGVELINTEEYSDW